MKRIWRALAPAELRNAVAWLRFGLPQALRARAIPPAGGLGPPSSSAAIVGFQSSGMGMGMAAELCAAELTASGVPVRAFELDWRRHRRTLDVAGPADEALIFHVNPDTLGSALTQLPPAALHGRRRIGYWVWESEQAPSAWRRAAGWLDEIWAPSAFAAAAIRGATGREVAVVPHPVALRPASERGARRTTARAQWDVADAFVVATTFAMSSSLERKNAIGAIAAFARAFPADAGAALIVRATFCAAYPAARARLEEAAAHAGANVQLILHEESAGFEEVEALYAAADAYISLHRAEGFGLTLAEAMLRGLPVVATNWSGNADFMDERCALMVPATLRPVDDPQRIYPASGGRWAEPDLDVAAAHLRRLRDDPNFAAELGARAIDRIKLKLSGGAAARALRG